MNDKIKNMETIIALGTIILIFAGILSFFSITNFLLNTVILLLISILFLIFSNFYDNNMKDLKRANLYYYLGLGFIVVAFFYIGINGLLGDFISINGEGSALFYAILSILIGILSLITYVKNKQFIFIHILYLSIIMMIFCILLYFKVDYLILLIILNIILLLGCIIKKSDVFDISLFVLSIFSLLLSLIISDYDLFFKLIILSLIVIVNTIYLLFRKRDIYKVLVMILIFLNVYNIYNLLVYVLEDKYLLLIVTFILCLFELINGAFNLIKEKSLKITYKVYNNLFIVVMLFNVVDNALFIPGLIILFMYLLTSIIIAKVYKDSLENSILIFKILFSLYILFKIVPFEINDLIINIVLNIVMLLLYAFTKKDTSKKIYLILIIMLILNILFSLNNLLYEYFIYLMLFLLDYFIIVYKSEFRNGTLGKTIYTLLIIFMIFNDMSLDSVGITSLIIAMILSIFAYGFRNNKFNFSVSLVGILFLIYNYLTSTFVNNGLSLIIFTIIFYIILYIFNEYVIEKNNDLIISIILFIWLTYISFEFITIIFVLISCLIGLIISAKNKKYNEMFYLSILEICICLIRFVMYYINLTPAMYLLGIGFIIIIIGSIMIYKYKGSTEEKEDTQLEKKHVIKYCSNCGNKINNSDSYCGKCGNKI